MPQTDLDKVVVAKKTGIGLWMQRLRTAAAWTRTHAIAVGIVIAVTLLPVVGGSFLVFIDPPPEIEEEPDVTLDMALTALDAGNLNEAHTLAEILATMKTRPGEAGGPTFVFGAVANARADELLGEKQLDYRQLAARHLADSRRLGFPQGRETEGLYLLSRNVLLAGNSQEAIPLLEAALTENPAHEVELWRLLAQAHMDEASPDPRAALPYLDKLLADDSLDAGQRSQILLDRAGILFRLDDRAACRQTLEQVPSESQFGPPAALLQARMLLQDLDQQRPADGSMPPELAAGYRQALEILAPAEARSPLSVTAREAMYLSGVCLRALRDDVAALVQFQKTARLHGDTPEGIAAHHAVAGLLLADKQDEPAMRALIAALDAAGPEDTYQNTWLPIAALRKSALELYRGLLERNQHDLAVELTDHLQPVFAADQTAQLAAEAHRTAAQRLSAEAEKADESQRDELRFQATREMRQAGEDYARLAALRFSQRDYPDQVWNSAEAFTAGQDYRSAAAMYREYLFYEVRKRQPAALVGLGESLLQIGELNEALAILRECMDRYPQDAASFRGRLLASKARFEQGEVPAAEELLRENLNNDDLAPASREWRESLFQLGWLLHYQGRWGEANERLEEAVERYPNDPSAVEARYLIAYGYEANARVAQRKHSEATADGDRLAHGQELQRLLRLALNRYDAALQALLQRQEQHVLSENEQRLLRNAYFGKGAVLADLGRFDEAIGVYSTAANRYHFSPAALEAYLRIAGCYRRMDRRDEFKGTLERAKIVLRRLPDDAPYTAVTNYNRQQWGDLLDWLGAL